MNGSIIYKHVYNNSHDINAIYNIFDNITDKRILNKCMVIMLKSPTNVIRFSKILERYMHIIDLDEIYKLYVEQQESCNYMSKYVHEYFINNKVNIETHIDAYIDTYINLCYIYNEKEFNKMIYSYLSPKHDKLLQKTNIDFVLSQVDVIFDNIYYIAKQVYDNNACTLALYSLRKCKYYGQRLAKDIYNSYVHHDIFKIDKYTIEPDFECVKLAIKTTKVKTQLYEYLCYLIDLYVPDENIDKSNREEWQQLCILKTPKVDLNKKVVLNEKQKRYINDLHINEITVGEYYVKAIEAQYNAGNILVENMYVKDKYRYLDCSTDMIRVMNTIDVQYHTYNYLDTQTMQGAKYYYNICNFMHYMFLKNENDKL